MEDRYENVGAGTGSALFSPIQEIGRSSKKEVLCSVIFG
jgi:ribose 5-phosphate isomerase